MLKMLALMAMVMVAEQSPNVIEGTVTRVVDGDTIHVVSDGKKTIIRMVSIDAPESRQAYGKQSTVVLKKLVEGKTVRVNAVEKDRYGRTVGTIWRDDKDINGEMVRLGAAWYFPDYHKSQRYQVLHDAAKRDKRGLWSKPRPENPKDWRRRNR